MGEWKVQIPVKLDPQTVLQLDLLRGSYPFKPGRSTVIRELVEEGLRLIAEGIMQFRATSINRVPSVSSIPGTPEFPSAALESQLGPKPLTRVSPLRGKRDVRGREFRGVSRMDDVEVVAAYKPLSFPGLTVCLNSTYKFIRRAA